jgi:hypothetical protein
VNKSAIPPKRKKKEKGEPPEKGKPRPISGELCLGVEELHKLLGISVKSVREQAGRGQLPYSRIAGRIVFERSQIELFLAARRVVTLDEALRNVGQETR